MKCHSFVALCDVKVTKPDSGTVYFESLMPQIHKLAAPWD